MHGDKITAVCIKYCLLRVLGDIAGEEACQEADQSAAKGHQKEGEDGHNGLGQADRRNGQKGLHGVVEDNRHAVVEERLAKDEEVEALIHVYLL